MSKECACWQLPPANCPAASQLPCLQPTNLHGAVCQEAALVRGSIWQSDADQAAAGGACRSKRESGAEKGSKAQLS